MCEKYGSGAGSDLPSKEAAKKKKRESQLMGRAGRAVEGSFTPTSRQDQTRPHQNEHAGAAWAPMTDYRSC